METEAPISNTYLWYKSYDDLKEYPLSESFGFLVVVVIAYLAFVLKIGPDFMKNREPYKLKNTILIYNFIQVVLSALFCVLTTRAMIITGLFPKVSTQNDPEQRKAMFLGVYIYFLGKLTELLDTIFFVLRKKYNQVSFLHVYHHASVVIGTWMMVFYSLNASVVYGGFINSLVHVVMYFYYFMAALGPQYAKYLTWKKYITTFQLVQFVSMFLHQVICLIVTKGEHTIIGVIYVFYSTTLFFVLFFQFYLKSYNKTKKVASNGTPSGSEEKAKDQ